MPAVTGGQDNYLFNMEVMVTGMQRNEATYYTAAQLAARGNNDIPRGRRVTVSNARDCRSLIQSC